MGAIVVVQRTGAALKLASRRRSGVVVGFGRGPLRVGQAAAWRIRAGRRRRRNVCGQTVCSSTRRRGRAIICCACRVDGQRRRRGQCRRVDCDVVRASAAPTHLRHGAELFVVTARKVLRQSCHSSVRRERLGVVRSIMRVVGRW